MKNKKPRVLDYNAADHMNTFATRECRVSVERRGGCGCCDLCMHQDWIDNKTVHCTYSDPEDVPEFKRKPRRI